MSVTKQRDLDKAWSGAFKLEVHTLGTDEDGDAITSCTVRHVGNVEFGADGKPVRARAATVEEAAVLTAVAALNDAELNPDRAEKPGARTVDIVAAMQASEDKLSENTARRRIERIAARGWIIKLARGRWELSKQGETVHFGLSGTNTTDSVFD